MWLSRYVCLFFFYSAVGWVYESVLCTVNTGKWENRGFLFGPICPIYGCGAVTISAIAAFLPGMGDGPTVGNILRIFLISFFGSMVLEYATSWVLEKLFHAVWWDYSDLPFNLNGRISLFTALGFGIAGPLVVFLVAPPVERMALRILPIVLELVSLVLTAVAMCDVTLTVSALTDFERKVVSAEERFNGTMDALVDEVQTSMSYMRQVAVTRVRAFRYPRIRNEFIARIKEELHRRL